MKVKHFAMKPTHYHADFKRIYSDGGDEYRQIKSGVGLRSKCKQKHSMKVSLIFLAALSLTLAEPPVPSNQYLPASRSFSRPSSTYGAPSGFSAQTSAIIKPSSRYGAPSSQYSAPSSQYGAPAAGGFAAAPSSQYGAPGALAGGYSAPSSQYGAPSNQYSAPASGAYSAPSSSYAAPSSQYGAPSSQYGAPSSQYGAPGGYAGRAGGYDDQAEPANYQFEYHVEDAASGNDFGHQEARQGDVAQGKYFVLLPDGRRQVVEYTADLGGYKPRISYEQVGGGYGASGAGGYSGGGYSGAGGNGGYQY